MIKKSNTIVLAGGLGNQLYQLRYFFYLESTGKDVKIDSFSGFIFDRDFNRKSRLAVILDHKLGVSFFLLFRLLRFLKFPYIRYINFLIENSPNNLSNKNALKSYHIGYWQQDILKFNRFDQEICRLIDNKFKVDSIPFKIGDDSIALCLRAYEEFPEWHQKSLIRIDEILKELIEKHSKKFKSIFVISDKPNIRVTSILREEFENVVECNSDNGWNDWTTINLIGAFHNIAVTQSSLYDWGVKLARYRLKSGENLNVYFEEKYLG